LGRGELAYNENTKLLFIGSGDETNGVAANHITIADEVTSARPCDGSGTQVSTDVTLAGSYDYITAGGTGNQTLTLGQVDLTTDVTGVLPAANVVALNAITSPAGNVSMTTNGTAHRITGLGAPTAANDAVRKADLDNAIQGLDVRDSVRVAHPTDYDITTSTSAFQIDGVTLVVNDRILLKSQTVTAENGVYAVAYTAPNWSIARATDANAVGDLSPNMFYFVEEGTANSDTGWVCTTNGTVSFTNMTFAQFSGTGSYTATDGLDITGTAFGIADAGVTLAKMDNMATTSILGRKTASAGVPEVLSAANARIVMSVDAAGTDNSTDVTVTGEDYLSIDAATQVLTAAEVDLTDNVTGTLPVGSGGTGATTLTTKGVVYANGANAFIATAAGTVGQLLMGVGASGSETAPVWGTSLSGITIDCGTF
jgi:hypothetical protein